MSGFGDFRISRFWDFCIYGFLDIRYTRYISIYSTYGIYGICAIYGIYGIDGIYGIYGTYGICGIYGGARTTVPGPWSAEA